MPVVPLTSAEDPRLADYHDVLDPELVHARGLFVAEGRLVVERLIAGRRWHVRSLFLSDAACRALAPSLALLPTDTPIYVGPPGAFRAVTGFDVHRGCLALAERRADPPVGDLLSGSRLLIVLESVANADNVGGVFRNARAFGVDAVLLSPTCCDPLYRKAIRTSVGATLAVPFARVEPWPQALGALRAAGISLVALTPRESAVPLHDFARRARPERLALLVGAEGAGLSDESPTFADVLVRIPIAREMDSLNLAVATGIVLARLSDPRPL